MTVPSLDRSPRSLTGSRLGVRLADSWRPLFLAFIEPRRNARRTLAGQWRAVGVPSSPSAGAASPQVGKTAGVVCRCGVLLLPVFVGIWNFLWSIGRDARLLR